MKNAPNVFRSRLLPNVFALLIFLLSRIGFAGTAPTITLQPQDQIVISGSNVAFTATVTGDTPLVYAWYFNGTSLTDDGSIQGSETNNLNIFNAQTNSAGSYQLVVTNNFGSVTSDVATLTVLLPPGIINQSTNQTAFLTGNIAFTVVGSGTDPLLYQWQLGGTNLSDDDHVAGTTTATLTISNIQMSDAGIYDVVVSNAYGAIASAGASLAVVPIAIWGDSSSGETNAPLTVTNAVAISARGHGAENYNLGLNSDGTVAVWGFRASSAPDGLSNVVQISAGIRFAMALKKDGSIASWGDTSFGETTPPPGLTNVAAVSAGYISALALKQDGTAIAWGYDGDGETNVPTGLSNVVAIAEGSFHGLALKSDGTVVGWGYNEYHEATSPPGLSNVVALSAGGFHNLALKSDGTVAGWGYNYFGEATVPDGLSNVVAVAAGNYHSMVLKRDGTVVAWGNTTVPDGLTNVVGIAAGDVHSLALVQNPTVQVPPLIGWQGPTNRTLPTGQTTIFVPYVSGSLPFGFQWYFNGNLLQGQSNAWLALSSIQPEQAGSYQFVVTNNYGAATSQVFTVSETPIITAQPTNQTVLLSSNVSFTATAFGVNPLIYHWYLNGTPVADNNRISGSATGNLNILNTQTNDAGSYQLVVTNAAGAITSAVANLTILVPAAISIQPTNRAVLPGSNAVFSVTAVGTAPLSYLWYSNSAPLANGGRFNGVTSATLTISGATTNDSGTSYQVVVTNNYGATTSSIVTLTVQNPVQITNQPASAAVMQGSNAAFSVAATGTALNYQWYFSGTPLADGGRISGSATPTINISNVQSGDSGGYLVIVTNLVSAATSHLASLTPQTTLLPTTRYVNLSNMAPAAPYLNWNTAATNIQDAIDAAVAGDLILVSNGIYKTGSRVMYGATNRVVVDKAVFVQSVNGSGSTLITGTTVPTGNEAIIRCTYLTNGATLAGFTLTNGGAFRGDIVRQQSGGGVWCESGAAVISNCLIVGNISAQFGGGAFQGTFYNCILTNNRAGKGGAACSNALFNCTLAKNTGSFQSPITGGGTIYSTLSNCVLVANSSSGGGGGAGACILTSCVLSNNSASVGGALCMGTATDCLISSNSAGSGGGAYSNTLNNCILKGNFASSYGAGAYGSALENCTVVNNSTPAASGAGGGIYLGIASNCIVFYNFSPQQTNFLGTMPMSYCCTPTVATNGYGNITNDPLFIDSAADFHLQSTSPCINSGDNLVVATSLDFDGNPRITGSTVDMGAYEFQTPASVLSYAWAQQHGLPIDGSADFLDSDGDGMNNWQEWVAGTDPNDAASVLSSFIPSATNNANVTITWASVGGVVYYLQRGTNLTAPLPFSTIQSNIPGQPGTTSYTDTNASGPGPFLYRIGVQH